MDPVCPESVNDPLAFVVQLFAVVTTPPFGGVPELTVIGNPDV